MSAINANHQTQNMPQSMQFGHGEHDENISASLSLYLSLCLFVSLSFSLFHAFLGASPSPSSFLYRAGSPFGVFNAQQSILPSQMNSNQVLQLCSSNAQFFIFLTHCISFASVKYYIASECLAAERFLESRFAISIAFVEQVRL